MNKCKPGFAWRRNILRCMNQRQRDGYTFIDWPYQLTPVQRSWLEETQGCSVKTVIPMFEEECYEHIEFCPVGLRQKWSVNFWWTLVMRSVIKKRKRDGYTHLDWPLPFTPAEKAWLEEVLGCSVRTVIPMFEEECYEHIQFGVGRCA